MKKFRLSTEAAEDIIGVFDYIAAKNMDAAQIIAVLHGNRDVMNLLKKR